MKNIISKMSITALLATGCGQKASNDGAPNSSKPATPTAKIQPPPALNPVNVKVYVDAGGRLFVNGRAASLEALDKAILEIKPKNGAVFYTRGNPEGEAPAGVEQVIDVIAKHGLPVQFFTDSSFTQTARLQ